MRNRHDKVTLHPDGGVKCDWQYSRILYLCEVFPSTAALLLRKAMRQWPIRLGSEKNTGSNLADASDDIQPEANTPSVSFIIGHKGLVRLPHLLATLRTIQQQVGVPFECIVVEQDAEPLIRDRLPDGVVYLHAPLSAGEVRYNRSAAYNAGSKLARGKMLILHDNDLLAPVDYAAEAWRLYTAGYEVVQLKRFIFYLNEVSTNLVFTSHSLALRPNIERVIENMEGGTTLGISASAFDMIGGMDEEFVGWGGEDNEFWDRCLTRKVWEYAYLPFVHLWHPSLAERRKDMNPSLRLLEQKQTISPEERIKKLLHKRSLTP